MKIVSYIAAREGALWSILEIQVWIIAGCDAKRTMTLKGDGCNGNF